MVSFIFPYVGFWGCESKCKLYIREIDDITHICFEELPDNPGTSVTNISEQLATYIVENMKLKSENCKFYETYPAEEGNLIREERSFDEIQYTWDGNKASTPKWRASTNKEIFNF